MLFTRLKQELHFSTAIFCFAIESCPPSSPSILNDETQPHTEPQNQVYLLDVVADVDRVRVHQICLEGATCDVPTEDCDGFSK